MKEQLILAINPGSTSTKIAVFNNNNKEIFLKNIKHTAEEIAPFKKITDQYEFRKKIIIDELNSAKIPLETIVIVVGRGGLVKPIPAGVYEVNDKMLEDLKNAKLEHASNLGALIATNLSKSIPGSRAFIADPVVVDELEDLARIAGHPLFERISIFHALNQKAISRLHAKTQNKKYEELNLIVAHLGGGISVGAHKKGKVIDVNQALDGDGPFSPERSGSLPMGQMIEMCFSGKYTKEEIKKMVTGKGGFVAYLGTNDAHEVEKRALAGDEKAKYILDALVYQVAKEIGAMSTVLKGEVDGILITGGIAYGKPVVASITERVKHIGQVFVYPGEDEMAALAGNGLMVLEDPSVAKEYK